MYTLDFNSQRDFSIFGGPLKLKNNHFKYLGNEIKIWPNAKLVNTENISIGHRTIIDDFTFITALGGLIDIGKFVHIASFCSITGTGGFIMEDFSGLAAGVRISTSDEDYSGGTCLTNPTIPKEYRMIKTRQVIIKKHAIIGTNTVILPGVTIGEGCAVGANSLITKNLEPWTIYVGSPAKPLKTRNKESILALEQALFNLYPQYL